MAITKETTYDYEVVNHGYSVQVRQRDTYLENGVKISSSLHRYPIHPNEDWSAEPEEIKLICDALFTDEVKQSWIDFGIAHNHPQVVD